MHGPLRYELTKYRRGRRRPLSGMVPGLPFPDFVGSGGHESGVPHVPRPAGHRHGLYSGDLPSEYDPSPSDPATQQTEYEPYEASEVQAVPRSTSPKLFRPFPDEPADLEHEDPGADDQIFLGSMQEQDDAFGAVSPEGHDGGDPSGQSDWLHEDDLGDYPDSDVDIGVSHQDMSVLDSPDIADLASTEAEPGVDPFQEAERIFEEQMKCLEEGLEIPGMEPGNLEQGVEQEGSLEDAMGEGMLLEDMLAEDDLGDEQGLEHIVEAEDGYSAGEIEMMEQDMPPDAVGDEVAMPDSMAGPNAYDAHAMADEINRAIEEVRQPTPQEPEASPFQMQPDPYMTAQQVFDEQLQYMADMMPGMGPMPGPGP